MSRPLQLRPAIRRFARDTGGAALVEFAITFPFMVFLFGMIIEGTRLMWDYQSAITGVRDATRYIARVVPAEICASADTGDSLTSYLPEPENRDWPFSRVDVGTPAAVLVCDDGGGGIVYRNPSAPVVRLSATLTIDLPFAGVFALIGGSFPSEITTVVTDESRVFGS